MKKMLLVIAMTIHLTSCIGYSVLSGGTSICHKNDKGYMCPVKDKAGILQGYGKPHKIELKDGHEYWTYNNNIAFRGLIIALIIPIPLIVPTGYNKDVFEFDNDALINTMSGYSKIGSAFLCGFIPTGEGITFGCY
jgi:hypothetical protein